MAYFDKIDSIPISSTLSKSEEYYLTLLNGEAERTYYLSSKMLENGCSLSNKKMLEENIGIMQAKIELAIIYGDFSKENIKKEHNSAINMILGKR